jgi:hypothetical protein
VIFDTGLPTPPTVAIGGVSIPRRIPFLDYVFQRGLIRRLFADGGIISLLIRVATEDHGFMSLQVRREIEEQVKTHGIYGFDQFQRELLHQIILLSLNDEPLLAAQVTRYLNKILERYTT